MQKQERLLITGNAGHLGRQLVRKLIRQGYKDIIGVDRRPLEKIPAGLRHFSLDLRRKSAQEILRKLKPESIIHLGVIRNPHSHKNRKAQVYFFNLESTTKLLQLAENLAIRKFVYLSTAYLYGPSANSQGILAEETPLHGANKSPEIRDLVSLDMMVQSFFYKQPQIGTIILRPCHIVGPSLQNAPSRYFMLDTIPTILGFDPMIQLLHVADLINALVLSLRSETRGIFNVAGVDVAPLSRIIKALGRPSMPLPETLLKIIAASTFFSRRSSFSLGELDHLKYSCIIDDSRAKKQLKFKPQKNTSAIVDEMRKFYGSSQSR